MCCLSSMFLKDIFNIVYCFLISRQCSLDKRGSESLTLYYVMINWHLTAGNATNHVTCVCSRGRDVEFKYRRMNKELIVKLKSSTICIGPNGKLPNI